MVNQGYVADDDDDDDDEGDDGDVKLRITCNLRHFFSNYIY